MTRKLKELIGRAETLPEEARDELLQLAVSIEHELGGEPYRASPDELRAIDEDEVAPEDEVEAAFAQFHRA